MPPPQARPAAQPLPHAELCEHGLVELGVLIELVQIEKERRDCEIRGALAGVGPQYFDIGDDEPVPEAGSEDGLDLWLRDGAARPRWADLDDDFSIVQSLDSVHVDTDDLRRRCSRPPRGFCMGYCVGALL